MSNAKVGNVDGDSHRARAWREWQQTLGGGPDLPMEIDDAAAAPTVVLDGYSATRLGRYWRLVYPDGHWQRTSTKREALRLAALHFADRSAWTVAVQGDGAPVR
ncbi:MAG: hypothetical protein O3B27_11175 [Actinomycetota bacterium]|nr:hypothetical protein [Actinomycetota bacterium]MDA2949907.1 hypothetical protein [Actinomycetota bacterium]MDA2992104.1 hypothetical protein [Actinomycetota bacterium]